MVRAPALQAGSPGFESLTAHHYFLYCRVLEYYRKGNADLRVGLLLAAGFLVGGYFGAAGAQHIPEAWLRRIFAVTLVAIGGRMFFTR